MHEAALVKSVYGYWRAVVLEEDNSCESAGDEKENAILSS